MTAMKAAKVAARATAEAESAVVAGVAVDAGAVETVAALGAATTVGVRLPLPRGRKAEPELLRLVLVEKPADRDANQSRRASAGFGVFKQQF